MNCAPLVSVIIPTKNRQDMVVRAIKSVLNQSYQNMEILVINDASTDGTASDLEILRATDSRLIIFNNTQSIGGAGARNIGLKNARGDYLAFLDDDDEWLPKKIEIQLNFLEENKGIDAVSSWHLLKINDQIQQIQKPINITFRNLLWENFLGSFSFCLVTRRVIDKVGLLDESLPSAQDWDFWLRVVNEFKAHMIDQYLVLYNRHDQERISSSYAGKARGSEILYNKYRQHMNKDCSRHHEKYIIYYKSLSEKDALKRFGQLVKLIGYIRKKHDWLLFFNSFFDLILPAEFTKWFKSVYRKMMMNKKNRLLGVD